MKTATLRPGAGNSRGPNLLLAMHRRARDLGLIREPERTLPWWALAMIGVGMVAVGVGMGL